MAVSLNLPTLPNLYCNEAASEAVPWTADHDDDNTVAYVSSHDPLIDYDDGCLISMFDAEVDQMMLQSKVLSAIYDVPEIVTARQEAVQWILKVHDFHKFRPETAYLCINYLDRFLSARALPAQQGKAGGGWPMQLLSVACLSVAAKMEETSIPFLLDLQILKPRFLFKPKTVQRMELLVMNTLKWRLRTLTPFHFVHYFIARISCISDFQQSQSSMYHLCSSCASHLIIHTCKVIDSLDYPPSAIAAAVALWLTNRSVDEQNLNCLHERVNKETVKKISNIIQTKICSLPHNINQPKLEPLPPSPTCVLEAAMIQGSCKLPKIGNKEEFKQ